jgi:thiosulfate/3-mercaptopyruvate sulfurtransferase
MEAGPSRTILSVEELLARLDDPNWVVVDVRYDLSDPDAGRRAYLDGHVPGAQYADLGRDLSAPPRVDRGRHPLPGVEAMAATFGMLGIGPGVQVVVYDARNGMYAARLWWMLRYLGHDSVAVLDGGLDAWRRAGFALESGEVRRSPRRFVPKVRPDWIAGTAEVEASRTNPDRLVVDSRSADRYRGENETIDPVAGHIPGARNHFFGDNVESDGRFREPADLARSFAALLGERDPRDAIFYCGSGVTACQNLLALEIAGMSGARLYPGSWSEWIGDRSRPVAVGTER